MDPFNFLYLWLLSFWAQVSSKLKAKAKAKQNRKTPKFISLSTYWTLFPYSTHRFAYAFSVISLLPSVGSFPLLGLLNAVTLQGSALIFSVMQFAWGIFTPTTSGLKTPQSSSDVELSLWISRSLYVTANYQISLFGYLFCTWTSHGPSWTYLSLLNQPLKQSFLSIVNDTITCLVF